MSRKTVLLCLTLSLPSGCEDKDDDKNQSTSGSGSSSGAWLVGDDGQMWRIAGDGAVTPYPAQAQVDLRAIACVGRSEAWVVGEGGTLLSTADGGESWQQHALAIDRDLVAVAVSEPLGAAARVVVAGDGVLLASVGDGSFVHLDDGDRDWTGVAVDASGARLLAVADDGSVWRMDEGEPLRLVARFEAQPLAAVALSPAGDAAVVVGAAGFVARSGDGGGSWQAEAVPTTRDLWAARIDKRGLAIVAVGDAGAVVRIDESGATAQEQLDPALALRALHLHAGGGGHAVGDAGTVLVTHDAGASWDAVALPSSVGFAGVDDIQLGPHW